MRYTLSGAMVIATIFLSGCVAASTSGHPSCSFVYDQRVIKNLVLPTLMAAYGPNYVIYDVKNPGLLEQGNIVQIILRQPRIDVLDTPNFIIVVDQCASRVIEAHESAPFPSDGPK